jgi:sterol 3beta-glucosyltransferase/vancomycin aglycone glucosyltransferase
VRPFLALAAGLVRAGHEVTLALLDHTGQDWTSFAERDGYRLISIPSVERPPEAEMDAMWRRMLAAGPLRQMDIMFRDAFDLNLEAMIETARRLCAANDLVIGHFLVHPLRAAAQAAGVPMATMTPVSYIVPTAERPPYGVPDLGRWSYPLFWRLGSFVINRVVLRRVNEVRSRFGLPPDRDAIAQSWVADRLNLIAASPVLCPPPGDWGANHVMCGFLDRPVGSANEPVPAEIEAFLDAGVPPVYLTFGSMMTLSDAYRRETAALLREAVRLAGVRAIIQVPGIDETEGDCLIVSRSPYASVFPRCALVVHHGGAGTTQTALKAGVPALVVAHIADQFFWGAHLAKLGVAAPPLKRRGLTAKTLAKGGGGSDRPDVRLWKLSHGLHGLMRISTEFMCQRHAYPSKRNHLPASLNDLRGDPVQSV